MPIDDHLGAAKRRRERRLRQFLRHERLPVAMVLSEKKHHTSRGSEEGQDQGGGARLPPQAAATEYYRLTDEEGGELVVGARPTPLAEGRPQGKVERHGGIGYEHDLALDAPVLQMVEEVDDVLLPPLVLQEQAIVLEIPEVPRPSSVVRAVQPTDFEQVLDVPVLHMDHDDHMFSKFLEQLILQSTPEVQVDRVQQRFGEQIVDLTVPHEPVHQRNVEQVVDVHDPLASLSGRYVEQVVDFVEPHGAPGVALAQQLASRVAAAWLDAPQVHSEGFFFRTFPRHQKSAKGTGQSSAEMVSHTSPSTSSAYSQSTWIDGDIVPTRCESA